MRLGFWNRLAIVATVLAALIVPLYIMFDITSDIDRIRKITFDACIKLDAAPALERSDFKEYDRAYQACTEQRFPNPDPSALTFDHWLQFLGGTLMGCAILYVLIWGIAATARWVWRGRPAK